MLEVSFPQQVIGLDFGTSSSRSMGSKEVGWEVLGQSALTTEGTESSSPVHWISLRHDKEVEWKDGMHLGSSGVTRHCLHQP